jgi:hypothetical protein
MAGPHSKVLKKFQAAEQRIERGKLKAKNTYTPRKYYGVVACAVRYL